MDEFEDDAPPVEHNSTARQAAIKKAHAALIPLEEKVAELNSEMRGIRQTLKADTGLKIGDFQAIRRLIMLEDDELNATLDNLKECFDALHPGMQLDFVEAMESKAA